MLVSKQSPTHCSHRNRWAFNTRGRPKIRSPCWHRTSRIAFQVKRRPELCLSTSQQAKTPLWHRGLTCKKLRLLPDRHTVHMIMKMVINRSFTLLTGNGHRSRLRCLKNVVPQGSVLAPLMFNIYISGLPAPISRKYAYANDLAIMHADGDWLAVEGALSNDMATLSEYLQKLKLSTVKMVSAVFHLNNKEAKRELKVTLDRSLTYCRHLESLRNKLISCVALLRRLAGSGCGAGETPLRTATLFLVHSTEEYCAPVWCCSAHTRLI